MKRLLALGLLLTIGLLLQPVVGFAAWISQGSGTGSTSATSVSKVVAPVVSRSGNNAVASWPQGVLANGVVATGYVVQRKVGATTTTVCTTTEPTRTCTDSSPVAGAASYTVRATYRSWVGPASDPTVFTFDTDAPVSMLTSNPAANSNGYVTSAPTLTVSATDASSAVASITYRIGSSSPVTVNGASTSFVVPGTADSTVTYFATDIAGNIEAPHSYLVKRDSTAPTTTASANPAPNIFGYFTTAPTLTLTATDAETSVASISYKIGTGPLTTANGASASFTVPGPGTTTVTYYATDTAGNVEATKSYTVARVTSGPSSVTITDPVQNGSYVTSNSGQGSWAKTCGSRGGICATAVDTQAPIAGMTYRLIKNGNTCWNGTAFVSGTACSVAMTFDSANSDWIGGPTRQQMGASLTWSLTVTATNQAGLSTTSTTVTFKTT